ncbi:hypothetical protein [Roseisalinus antarcticus]|uniref:hypothetical protein n=1 Tax=Roseisalinus antarcticus TaxID=254357 RepID=UPI00135656EC|nr:hypothetical protein [Roseisalinus antarcticus]
MGRVKFRHQRARQRVQLVVRVEQQFSDTGMTGRDHHPNHGLPLDGTAGGAFREVAFRWKNTAITGIETIALACMILRLDRDGGWRRPRKAVRTTRCHLERFGPSIQSHRLGPEQGVVGLDGRPPLGMRRGSAAYLSPAPPVRREQHVERIVGHRRIRQRPDPGMGDPLDFRGKAELCLAFADHAGFAPPQRIAGALRDLLSPATTSEHSFPAAWIRIGMFRSRRPDVGPRGSRRGL